ncbi:glycoside hydrolase family 114 protein [Piromyces sp. E2]|nr:glycoside hydrolase family 114 protein [Piromyces sp. E2]|eukprot:OUM57903.1 glycoside hydrolase family 114 protein [Piromyces sp. E2]
MKLLLPVTFLASLLLVEARWQPTQTTKYNIVFGNTLDLNKEKADAVEMDLDRPLDTIRKYQKAGKKVICYFSAGTIEKGRDDYDKFHEVPGLVRNIYGDWPNERWIDYRVDGAKSLMKARIKKAADKGCDAVEADNVDGYQIRDIKNVWSKPLTKDDAVKYLKWLGETAHSYGLSIGIKNCLDIIDRVTDYFDFAVNEGCIKRDECYWYKNFLATGKPVFGITYNGLSGNRSALCRNLNGLPITMIIKPGSSLHQDVTFFDGKKECGSDFHTGIVSGLNTTKKTTTTTTTIKKTTTTTTTTTTKKSTTTTTIKKTTTTTTTVKPITTTTTTVKSSDRSAPTVQSTSSKATTQSTSSQSTSQATANREVNTSTTSQATTSQATSSQPTSSNKIDKEPVILIDDDDEINPFLQDILKDIDNIGNNNGSSSNNGSTNNNSSSSNNGSTNNNSSSTNNGSTNNNSSSSNNGSTNNNGSSSNNGTTNNTGSSSNNGTTNNGSSSNNGTNTTSSNVNTNNGSSNSNNGNGNSNNGSSNLGTVIPTVVNGNSTTTENISVDGDDESSEEEPPVSNASGNNNNLSNINKASPIDRSALKQVANEDVNKTSNAITGVVITGGVLGAAAVAALFMKNPQKFKRASSLRRSRV